LIYADHPRDAVLEQSNAAALNVDERLFSKHTVVLRVVLIFSNKPIYSNFLTPQSA
jgi:hypothetical protein